MVDANTAARVLPRWEEVAGYLDQLTSGPTPAQAAVAEKLAIEIPSQLPAAVAAAVIRHRLADVFLERQPNDRDVPEVLGEIEDELGVARTRELLTGTRDEVTAWFAARYALKTARALRILRPEIGDVVECTGWAGGERRLVSSIGNSGRVYMKRHPPRSAWPNHLTIVARVGSAKYSEIVQSIDASIRNASVSTSTNFDNFKALDEYLLRSHAPAPEGVRALEEILESGERLEAPLQSLLTKYPELLAATVVGNWRTYVIPKPRLGAEYVPDFLVLGINSLGPQWVTVEIEAASHKITNKDKTLSPPTRHAVNQISSWREWLTTNVAYVQNEHKLYGLTNRAPGLVIIGRGDPSADRVASRAASGEESNIAIHSWDWLLRNARNLSSDPMGFSSFAVKNVDRVNHVSPGENSAPDGNLLAEWDDLVADWQAGDADEVNL